MKRPVALLFAPVLAFAIAGSALSEDLVGTVADANGQAVRGAQVIAHSRDGQATESATTDANGHYRIAGLDPGQYFITLDAASIGGRNQTVAGYVGDSGLTVNWSMAPGTSPIASAQPGTVLSSAANVNGAAAAVTASSDPPPGCKGRIPGPPCGPKTSKKRGND
jgi:hypothetical protein